jgi:hypothetical protein
MALIGGGGAGGAGNVAGGSNPSGTGTGITYLGNHAYGYSGSITANGSETIALKFNTSSEYINGLISVVVDHDDISSNFMKFQIKVNGQIVLNMKERRDLGSISDMPYNFIAPSFSEIELICPDNGTAAAITVLFTGRVY